MRASRRYVAVILTGLMLALWGMAGQAQTFPNGQSTAVHPGILVSQQQLNYIRAMVQAHVDPIYSAYIKAVASSSGSLTYQQSISGNLAITGGLIVCGSTSNPNYGCSDSDDDATAAYLQAVLWYVTGNQTYANNAIALMNYYAQHVTGYGNTSGQVIAGLGTVSSSNTPLQAGWDAQKWPRAAEIIRWGVPNGPASATSWNPTYGTAAGQAQAAAFGAWMKNVIQPQIQKGSSSNGNWEISMIEGLIGIGVYNDDAATFNLGVTYWKQRIPATFYYYTDGSSPVQAPRGTASWYGQTLFDASMNGVQQESCRDFGHAQYSTSGAFDVAETAHIQGTTPDLYQDMETLTGSAATGNANQGTFAVNAQNRLTSILEFNSYYLLNNPIPTTLCANASAYQSVANNSISLVTYPTNEIGYNHYHNRLGVSLPYTLKYLNQTIRNLANPTEYHIMVYETLTHGGDASQLTPFLLWTNASSATLPAGQSANFTVTVIPGSSTTSNVGLTLTGLPSGATYSFSPSVVSGSGTSTLQISAGNGVAPGVYPLTITGNDGTSTYTNTLSLLVNAADANFALTSTTPVVSVTAGDMATVPLTLTALDNYIGNVTLSVASGLPTGATATFTPAAIALSGAPQAATLNLTTLGLTQPGIYNLTIAATDGTRTNTTQIAFNVAAITNACVQQMGYYWVTGALPPQTGSFTAEWDATPALGAGQAQTNANVGFSSVNLQTVDGSGNYTDLAVAGRFNTTGTIDARNGSTFAAINNIPYIAGQKYHFRAVVNVPTATYSIYVTPPGQSEITIGTNYAFRSGAAAGSPASINFWNATAQVGSLALCNMIVDAPGFTLAATPVSQTAAVNVPANYIVNMTPVAGYAGTVTLSVTGLPSGATASFTPATLSSGSTSSTMQVSVTTAVVAGTYPFTITATDGTTSTSAYGMLTVAPACQSPVANAQSITVNANGNVGVQLTANVGTNCNATNPLSYAVSTQPQHGALTGVAPNLQYTPAAGYVGNDSFSFTASDAEATPATGAPAVVRIAVNQAKCTTPQANAQSLSVIENRPLAVTLNGTPGSGCLATNPLTAAITVTPLHGTLSGTAPNLVYTPTRGYVGTDSFSYTVSDSNASSSTSAAAAVMINVAQSSCVAPIATAQSLNVPLNGALAVTLNGTPGTGCPASDLLSYTVTSNPAHGVLTGTAPNVEYTPTQGYTGSDSFSFTVSDAYALTTTSSAANVSLTVTAPASLAPVLSGVSPRVIQPGSPANAATLMVSGSGFLASSTVQWNGTNLATTYVSSTQLTAVLPATNQGSDAVAAITVNNPGTQGGTSAAVAVAVDTNPSVVLSAKSTALSVQRGQSTTTTLLYQNLTSGVLATVSCYNLPDGASCSYNQQTQLLTVTAGLTTATGSYQVLVVSQMTGALPTKPAASSVVVAGLLGMPFGLLLVANKRRWLWTTVGILLLAVTFISGCSSTTSTTVPNAQAATTLTVTVQ